MTRPITTTRLELWLQTASTTEERLGGMLACALEADLEMAIRAYEAAWPGQSSREALSDAWAKLIRRPFVEPAPAGHRVERSFARTLLTSLQQAQNEAFVAIHRFLVENAETPPEVSPSSIDAEWPAHTLAAYYLAPIDAAGAVSRFEDSFEAAGAAEQGRPWAAAGGRQWVAALAIDRADYLDDFPRAISFYRAFAAYQRGDLAIARHGFAAVSGTDSPGDFYKAVSLHLWALLSPSDKASTRRLRDSVALSEQLAILENEVMARNTLVYRELSYCQGKSESAQRSKLTRLERLAQLNLQRAARSSKYLRLGASNALMVVRWNRLIGLERPVTKEAVSFAEGFDNLAAGYASLGAVDDYVTAKNLAACCLRDAGLFSRAFDEIREAAEFALSLEYAVPHTAKLRKTLGSMMRMLTNEERLLADQVFSALDSQDHRG